MGPTSTLACALTFRFGTVSVSVLETPLIVGGGGGGGGCGTADAKKLSNIAAGLDTAAAELIFLSSLIAFSGTGLLRADFSRTFWMWGAIIAMLAERHGSKTAVLSAAARPFQEVWFDRCCALD